MTQLCSICPRGCGVDRAGGQFGFCAVPDAPVVARAAPHFGEEPCISGTRGSGAVFFSGCNLRCVFCQNRTISRGEHGKEITVAQLRDIFLRLRDEGDLMAAQQLILSHLRLVVSIARGFLGYGLPHADLIQEGNIGLMKAIKHFDPDRGVRLMTFSVHWIRSEIQEYIVRNWRMVKLATTKNQRKLFFNLRQMKADEKSLSTSETERIAETLDVKPEEVREMEARLSGGDTPLESPGSTDAEDDNAFAPIDWLSREEDEPEAALEERDRNRLTGEILRNALDALDERSRLVVQARWLRTDNDGNPDPMTLQELASKLGVSAERVRQIEKKAIAKLRSELAADKDIL